VEVLFAADGLDAVLDVVADLALSEEVLLRAANGRSFPVSGVHGSEGLSGGRVNRARR